MFISPAYAQAAGGGDAGLGAFLPLILIFAVFYFLLIRPQQKKAKAHREMLAAVRRGVRLPALVWKKVLVRSPGGEAGQCVARTVDHMCSTQ